VQEGLQAVAEAEESVRRTGERSYESELHRIRAELLLQDGRRDEAEAAVRRAIEIARSQQAKGFEARAEMTAAKLEV